MKYILQAIAAVTIFLSASTHAQTAGYDFWHAIEIDNARSVASQLKDGVDPNSRDDKGQVALYVALRGQSLSVAQELAAAPKLDPNAVNAVGETPLMMAALRGQVPIMETLIARGAAVHKDGWAPIHYAASSEEPKAVALLLDRGAPIDAKGPGGNTALMMAARYGKESVVDLLLARGADRTLRNDYGETPAMRAKAGGRDFLVPKLEAPR